MFGLELIEFAAFGKQVGIVIAGAASLWGFVFWRSSPRIAEKLLLPMFFGVGICFVFWFWFVNFMPAYAHEGITLVPSLEKTYRTLELFMPVFMAWFMFSLGCFVWWQLRRAHFLQFLPWFFALELAFTLALASFPVWLGEWSLEQWFFVGHNIHSIFTLGTVLILDYLFLISQRSLLLQQWVFPKLSLMSKVIWLGLGLDFLSVFLVFEEALQFTPKFFFMQTVIGIVIVNGVFLAGPIARRVVASVKEHGPALDKKWKLASEVSGTISICSWFTITFTDFFHHITIEYYHFLGFYVALIAILLCGHFLLQSFLSRKQIATP